MHRKKHSRQMRNPKILLILRSWTVELLSRSQKRTVHWKRRKSKRKTWVLL